MPYNLNDAGLRPVSLQKRSSVYRLDKIGLRNRYYIVSTEGTRRLMASPEVVGFDSYKAMLESTVAAMDHLLKEGLGGDFSILTILRGGLNYPLEECCDKCGLQFSNMNFLSCERVIENKVITGLDIKYEKLHVQKDAQLLIGDIIASGDTFKLCFNHVIEKFRRKGGSIRRIVFFTIGGTRAIDLLESRYYKIKAIWPEFEGFDCVFYEGVFSVYEDNGVTGVNIPMIDFGWKDGIVAPEFRSYVETLPDALFEKCIIYDGGARRYEIPEHIKEVSDYWKDLSAAAAAGADFRSFVEEKAGHAVGISYEDWLDVTRYRGLDGTESLYESETAFLQASLGRDFKELADSRLSEFTYNMQRYE